MRSTLGGWEPQVGDVVWQQMYSPTHPELDSTIEERVAGGNTYGGRRLMIVRHVEPGYDRNAYRRAHGEDLPPRLVTRWALQAHDPKDRKGEHAGYSGVEVDWCVLELVEPEDEGRLF